LISGKALGLIERQDFMGLPIGSHIGPYQIVSTTWPRTVSAVSWTSSSKKWSPRGRWSSTGPGPS